MCEAESKSSVLFIATVAAYVVAMSVVVANIKAGEPS